MSHNFLDHAAAAAAAAASSVFQGALVEAAESIRSIQASLTTCWRGVSADDAQKDLEAIIQRLSSAQDQAAAAGPAISRGQQRAREDELEADRREEEEEAARRAAAAAAAAVSAPPPVSV